MLSSLVIHLLVILPPLAAPTVHNRCYVAEVQVIGAHSLKGKCRNSTAAHFFPHPILSADKHRRGIRALCADICCLLDPGAAARDAISQFNEHVELNGEATQQTAVGSTITTSVTVQPADCNTADSPYSCAAELNGLQ